MHGLDTVDRALLWYNNHLLLWLTVVPFVTAFIGEYPAEPVVIALYGFVLAMAAIAFTIMIHHAFFAGKLLHHEVPRVARKKEFARSLIGVTLYGISVPLAFLHPAISLGIFILVPIYYFLPRSIVGDMAAE